ncbi:MAG: hypothetical protein MUC72_06760 [Acidobacteria bacterium]|jgi:hypothetical protein|nr:hypothetical protein [Acidobacteriota bacterium]
MKRSQLFLLVIFLSLMLSALLPAADKAYQISDLRPAGDGVQLILRDLENEGKLLQLVVYDRDRLLDLAAAEEIPATRARQGDILFLGGGKGSPRQMIITPGRSVHSKLAAGQAGEAKAINELSRRLAAESGAKAPAAAGSELDRVRRSFLFVLEFALGAPFTAAQERLILDPFSAAWWEGKSDEEKKSFAQYPQVVAWIMRAGQKELEEMRKTLEETTRQWLKESPASDPVVAMIRARLAERGRTIIAGEPPLTEMAAAAFSELYAYSRLLNRDGTALPAQLGEAEVAGARRELLRAWTGFSAAERAQVATAPGLWLVLRTLAVHGDAGQRETARRRLLFLTAGEAPAGQTPAGRSAKGDDAVSAMLKHNVLMNIRQQTFNTYMWSRGFNYQPATGKMW